MDFNELNELSWECRVPSIKILLMYKNTGVEIMETTPSPIIFFFTLFS